MAKRPIGITIIALLFFLGAIVSILGAVGGALLGGLGAAFLGPIGALLGAALAVVFIVIAIIEFVAGWGLWKLTKWGLYLSLLLSALGVIGGLVSLTSDIVTGVVLLIIDGAIFYYLWTKKTIFK